MKVGLVIPIHNRSNYVKQCFDSLLKLTVKPDIIVLVDDASTDMQVKTEIGVFSTLAKANGIQIEVITNRVNAGVRASLKSGIERLITYKDIYYVINLDSDAIVKPNFISVLKAIHFNCAHERIVSGFNVHNDKNPVTYIGEGFVLKPHANGINMCFKRTQYDSLIREALLKEGNWDYNVSLHCQQMGFEFAITVPSVVQHIGIQSSMGHVGGDFATDFKQLSLPNVTLFGIDSHDKDGITRAASISQRDIDFGAVKVITDDLFTKGGNSEVRRMDYSKFMLKELTKHFDTSHVLTIHADGYVVNWKAWSDEFLQYDYIGGVWDWYKDNQVGNGGLSLRSKKLCDILSEYELEHYHPEDHHICRTYRKALEQLGIKFAPVEVAKRFSREGYGIAHEMNMYEGEFGFHGYHVNWRTHEHYGIKKENLPKKDVVMKMFSR